MGLTDIDCLGHFGFQGEAVIHRLSAFTFQKYTLICPFKFLVVDHCG